MNILKYILIVFLMMTWLSGCAGMASKETEQQKTELFDSGWSKSVALTRDPCSEMSSQDIGKFLDQYYTPYISNKAYSPIVTIEYGYQVASTLGVRSQSCIADALGLKELATELRIEQDLMASGTSMSKSEIAKSRKLTSQANQQIAQALKEERQLKGEQRKAFAIGVAAFLTSANETLKLRDKFLIFADTTADAIDAADKKSLTAVDGAIDKTTTAFSQGLVALSLLRYRSGLAEHTYSLAETSHLLLDYALKNNIEVEEQADAMLQAEMGFEKE